MARISSSLIGLMLALTLSTLPATAAPHKGGDFNKLVHSIEHQYGVHHTHIPLLGMVMFFARPAGVHQLKLAVFDDFRPNGEIAGPEIQRMVEESFSSEWRPFVQTWSRNGETTLIYADTRGKDMSLLIVALDKSDATVVQLRVDENAVDRWLDEPDKMVHQTTGHHSAEAESRGAQ